MNYDSLFEAQLRRTIETEPYGSGLLQECLDVIIGLRTRAEAAEAALAATTQQEEDWKYSADHAVRCELRIAQDALDAAAKNGAYVDEQIRKIEDVILATKQMLKEARKVYE